MATGRPADGISGRLHRQRWSHDAGPRNPSRPCLSPPVASTSEPPGRQERQAEKRRMDGAPGPRIGIAPSGLTGIVGLCTRGLCPWLQTCAPSGRLERATQRFQGLAPLATDFRPFGADRYPGLTGIVGICTGGRRPWCRPVPRWGTGHARLATPYTCIAWGTGPARVGARGARAPMKHETGLAHQGAPGGFREGRPPRRARTDASGGCTR